MKFTRWVAVLLFLLLTLSLPGCEKIDLSGGKTTSGTTGGAVEESTNVLTVKTTLNGAQTFLPQRGTSPISDEILAQIARVEQTTGCTVEVETVTEEKLSTEFLRACRSGKKYADVIQTDAMFLTRHYNQGNLLSLQSVGLTPSKTGSLTTADGTAYGLRADGWSHPIPTASYLMYYNESIFAQSSVQTPLELLEENAWNWTAFQKGSEAITKTNFGNIYAIAHPTVQSPDLVWATLHAAGAVYFDQDGTCIMDNDRTLTGFAALQKYLASGVTYTLGEEIDNNAYFTATDAFCNGHTAFLVGNSSLLFDTGDTSLSATLEEDLRIIGFPSIASNAPGVAFSQADVFCGITAAANVTLCKTVLPALFSPPEGTDAVEALSETYFFHEEDAAIYFDLLSAADTDSSLGMTDNRSMVEELYLQVANGASAKQYLSNLESIFNSQQKG